MWSFKSKHSENTFLFLKRKESIFSTYKFSWLLFEMRYLWIENVATTSLKKVMKTPFKSIRNSVFVMIFFIFFECMVKKKFIVEGCLFCWKYHQISIEIYQFFKFLTFLSKFLYRNLENRNRCEYVSKKIYENIFQK